MWYAFGSIVLDRIFGCHAAAAVSVHAEPPFPPPAEIRLALRLSPIQELAIVNAPPRKVCNLDQLRLGDDGKLRIEDEEVLDPPRRLQLSDFRLEPEDVLRLASWCDRYEDLAVDDRLVDHLMVTRRFYEDIAPSFPELQLLLAEERRRPGYGNWDRRNVFGVGHAAP